MSNGLDALLRPRSVAVVGASRDRTSIGGRLFQNLIARDFQGPVYPVNPGAESVQSVRAYRTVCDIPGDVDLAVIVVPSARVLAAVDDCGKKGVKGVVVITAGFAELGGDGEGLQKELIERTRRYGMRLVGPNCLGVLNTDPAVSMNALFVDAWPDAGTISFSSQSGALGFAILDHAKSLGLGIRQFVSVGNKADVSGNDLLEYWEADEGTQVILFYLESLGRPGRFMRLARRVARTKPILVVKSGRSTAGARATSSHTGSLAGLDVAADALFAQAGVIRTDTIEELFDTALLLASQPVPKGSRVAVLTNAGGPGIMATDACEAHGLTLPTLSAATQQALRRFLAPEASVGNPVDMIASATAEQYEEAIDFLLADPDVDALLVLYVPPLATHAGPVAAAIQRATRNTEKTVAACFMGIRGVPHAAGALKDARVPSYAFPEAAAKALARAAHYGRWRARPEGHVPSLPGFRDACAAKVLDAVGESRWLTPEEVNALLEACGIRTPRTMVARSAEEAALAAETIGFPVAVKLASRTITHKSDVGGVRLGLRDAASVAEAFRAIEAALRTCGRSAEMDGVTVQEMAGRGVETFVGVVQDPKYGPLVAFGIGGVNVEVWKDVVFRVHPLTDVDAREMTEQIRGARLLEGVRGAPAVDRTAIVDAILRLDRLVGRHPEIAEIDVNPLLAGAVGEGVLAVDARIRLERR